MNKHGFLLLIIFLLIVPEQGILGQKRIHKEENYTFRMHYKKNQLSRVTRIFKYEDQRSKDEYVATWTKGEVHLINQETNGPAITYTEEYTFRFDSLCRIYEATGYCAYGNHEYETYLAKRFKTNDIDPERCYFYNYMNLPYEREINEDCESRVNFMQIIELELARRKEHYVEGCSNIEYKPSGSDMPFDNESLIVKFLFDR